jgi:hypothetical protein
VSASHGTSCIPGWIGMARPPPKNARPRPAQAKWAVVCCSRIRESIDHAPASIYRHTYTHFSRHVHGVAPFMLLLFHASHNQTKSRLSTFAHTHTHTCARTRAHSHTVRMTHKPHTYTHASTHIAHPHPYVRVSTATTTVVHSLFYCKVRIGSGNHSSSISRGSRSSSIGSE